VFAGLYRLAPEVLDAVKIPSRRPSSMASRRLPLVAPEIKTARRSTKDT